MRSRREFSVAVLVLAFSVPSACAGSSQPSPQIDASGNFDASAGAGGRTDKGGAGNLDGGAGGSGPTTTSTGGRSGSARDASVAMGGGRAEAGAEPPNPGDGSVDAGPSSPASVSGTVGKGPFILGSTITAFPVTSTGMQTGASYVTTTSDQLGSYDLPTPLLGPVLIQATGYYFDEVRGALSNSPITLWAYADVRAGSAVVNVNVITHLVHQRVVKLMSQRQTLASATAQAESELASGLGIGVKSFRPGAVSIAMSLSGGDTSANEYLLAVSAVFAQAAVTGAGGAASDAALEQLLNQVSADLASDGLIDAATVTELHQAEQALDTYSVKDALAARFASVGTNVAVPDLDQVVDTDGDGVANARDNCRTVSNPSQAHVNSICAYRRVASQDPNLQNLGSLNPPAIGDVNGDGIPDLAFVANVDSDVHLMQGMASAGIGLAKGGQFKPDITWGGVGGPGPLIAADLNGDGIDDLVSNEGYYAPGARAAAPPKLQVSLPLPYLPSGVDVGDIDARNHANDIVCSYSGDNDWSTGAPPPPKQQGYGVVVLQNNFGGAGVGTFGPLAPGVLMHGLAVFARHFMGAGAPLALVTMSSTEIDFAAGSGDGTFEAPTSIVQGNFSAATVGDFNGDGALDVAALLDDRKTIAVLVGDGQGQFAAPGATGSVHGFNMSSSSKLVVSQFRAAEMTGDNIDDVVDYDDGGELHVLVSGGTGLATEVVLNLLAVPHPPPIFALGDVNGDGMSDIVAETPTGFESFLIFR